MELESPSDSSDIERELAERLAAMDTLGAVDAAQELGGLMAGLETEAAERLGGALECLVQIRKLWPRREHAADWPQKFGKFVLERELGRGGHGVVFLAIDPTLGRRVALKIPRPECLDDPELKRRFFQEARAVAKLDHPGIVPLLELDSVGPVCYMASTYCSGPHLGAWLKTRQKPLSPREAAGLAADIAEAIGHAHARGVVHRDIKPQNILLEEDSATAAPGISSVRPRVTDFGLAKLMETDADRTRTGLVVGTPRYMAPEQAQARHADVGPATDVYAIGLILQELLIGRVPESGPPEDQSTRLLPHRIAGKGVSDTADTPGGFADVQPKTPPRSVPPPLEAIISRCLEHETGRRYGDAALLAADLRRYLAGERVLARKGFYRRALRTWAARRPALAISAVGIATITLTVTAFEIARGDRPVPVPAPAVAKEARAFPAERLARLNRYIEDMQLAYGQAPVGGSSIYKLSPARFLLDRHRPGQAEEDLRSLEWYYLWNVLHGERQTLKGPRGELYWVTYSPDGKSLAAAGADGAYVWDAASGELRLSLKQHSEAVTGVCFSPDNKRLATASEDRSACVWSAIDGRSLLPPLIHKSKVVLVLFTTDGKSLITIERGGFVTVWDAATGAMVRTVRASTSSPLEGMALSPDGSILATAASVEVRLWEFPSLKPKGSPIWSDKEHTFDGVTFSHDGRWFATAHGSETQVRVWETATGRLRFVRTHYPGERVMSVSFSPDDRALASTGGDCAAHIWNLDEAIPHTTLAGHSDYVWCATFAPDGHTLATASKDKTVKLWTVPPQRKTEAIESGLAGALAVGYSDDGRTLYTSKESGVCELWDSLSGLKLKVLPFLAARPSVSAAFSPDSTRIAVVDAEGTISVGSPDAATPLIILSHAGAQRPCLTFSSDSQRLAFVARDGSVGRIDATGSSPEIEWLQSPASAPTCLAFAPHGGFLVGGVERRLVIWDLQTHRLRDNSEFTTQEQITAASVSPDGSLCASNGAGGKILLWNCKTLRAPTTMVAETDSINCLAFAQDGRTLVAAGQGAAIMLWNVTTERQIFALKGSSRFTPTVAALCVAPRDSGVAAIVAQVRPGGTENVLWRTPLISHDAEK
jgi:WD40 repeat protein/tRNA A-37 threonylcarbamoyl transferase component Bud32